MTSIIEHARRLATVVNDLGDGIDVKDWREVARDAEQAIAQAEQRDTGLTLAFRGDAAETLAGILDRMTGYGVHVTMPDGRAFDAKLHGTVHDADGQVVAVVQEWGDTSEAMGAIYHVKMGDDASIEVL